MFFKNYKQDIIRYKMGLDHMQRENKKYEMKFVPKT